MIARYVNTPSLSNRGFSLVELSIVLVVLGLLVGGVLSGQALIRASQLRSISSDYSKYITATQTFRDKYFALPGDMTNATAFWGDQATGTSACASASTADGTPGTCNGNGNGEINPGVFNEWYRAWQHLAMAGLIEGSYLGIGVGWDYAAVAGRDVPSSKISPAGFTFLWTTQSGGNAQFGNAILPDVSFNWIMFSQPFNSSQVAEPLLTPEEAWNIDTKMDDGKPFQGIIRGGQRSICAALGTDINSNYALTSSSKVCVLAIKL